MSSKPPALNVQLHKPHRPHCGQRRFNRNSSGCNLSTLRKAPVFASAGGMPEGSYELTFGDERQTQSLVRLRDLSIESRGRERE